MSIAFEMFEDQENFDTIVKSIESGNVVRNLPEAVYTREEISAAQWLTVRSSWRSLYPQPIDEMGFRHTTYDSTDYCNKAEEENGGFHWCGSGLVQKEGFVLAKEPNWGPRNFLMVNCVEDELFISPKAEAALRESGLAGFDIRDVMNKRGSIMNGVRQLYVRGSLAGGLREDALQEKLVCPKCGFEKYITKAGANYFERKAFEGVSADIVKTKEKFGGIACFSLIIASHKFYEVVTDAKLDRGLVFEPVVLF